jgi:hypothetical protein
MVKIKSSITLLVSFILVTDIIAVTGPVLLAVGHLQPDTVNLGNKAWQSPALSNPVQPGSKTTYFDLLRKLLPDLKADATAHSTISFRNISAPTARETVEGNITVDFKPYWFKNEGQRLLLLWVSLAAEEANAHTPYAGEEELLAVFRLEPTVKLLDALAIKSDRFTGSWKDRPLFVLDPQNDAFIIYNTHWNAGESYLSLDMLFVDDGRLKNIASQFLFETQGCGANFTETPSFQSIPNPGNKYPNVLVKVKLTKKPDEDTCDHPTRGYAKYYQGLYHWNSVKRKYESNAGQLAILDKFNEKRVSSP